MVSKLKSDRFDRPSDGKVFPWDDGVIGSEYLCNPGRSNSGQVISCYVLAKEPGYETRIWLTRKLICL